MFSQLEWGRVALDLRPEWLLTPYTTHIVSIVQWLSRSPHTSVGHPEQVIIPSTAAAAAAAK